MNKWRSAPRLKELTFQVSHPIQLNKTKIK